MRLTLFLALLACPVLAEAPDQTSGLIARLETGVICAPPAIGENPAPGTVAGTTHIIAEEPPFVSLNQRVPAVLGIGFGAKAMAEAADGINPVTMVVRHPPMGPQGATEQSFETAISGLDSSLTFYQFDYDYEMVLGTWEMEARQGEKVLYRTTFEVVPPRLVPELASICGFENLLS